MPLVLHVYLPVMFNFCPVVVEMNSFDLRTKGQIPQGLLHGLVPVNNLSCLLFLGNLAWHNLFLG
jgi:hypothetical protein